MATEETTPDVYAPNGVQVSFNANLANGPIGAAWEIWPHRIESTLRMVTLISLGTDRVAADDDVLGVGENDRKGWWCDAFNEVGPIGSRLWILEGRPVTDESARLAKDYALEALAWMRTGGWVDETLVETWRPAGTRGRIAMTVDHITRVGPLRVFETQDLWEGLNG